MSKKRVSGEWRIGISKLCYGSKIYLSFTFRADFIVRIRIFKIIGFSGLYNSPSGIEETPQQKPLAKKIPSIRNQHPKLIVLKTKLPKESRYRKRNLMKKVHKSGN